MNKWIANLKRRKNRKKWLPRRFPLEGRGWGCLGPPRTVSSAPSSARTDTSWTPRRRLTQPTATCDSPRCSQRCCPWCLVRPASLCGGCRGAVWVCCPRAEDAAGGWPTESRLGCTWRRRHTRTHAGSTAAGTCEFLSVEVIQQLKMCRLYRVYHNIGHIFKPQ